MMDTHFLESFLRLNNIGTHAPKEEVTRVLVQAHWPPEQIEEALRMHASRETPTASQQLARRQQKQMFRPDMDWSSSTLSSLLGIDVIIDPASLHVGSSGGTRADTAGRKLLVGFGVTCAALVVAASIGLGLMYFFEIGPFSTHATPII